MKLQLAVDRMTIDEAIAIIEASKAYVDIIEVGTSLIKDYGNTAITSIRNAFPDITILADIKTIDEAAYEFRSAYEAGADIVTVMGAAAITTLSICQKVAKEYHKEYVIDLLEVNDDKLKQLQVYQDAIQCIHLPSDEMGNALETLIKDQKQVLNPKVRISAAGGITLDNVNVLKQCGIDIVVVGSAITKANNKVASAKAFYDEIRKEG